MFKTPDDSSEDSPNGESPAPSKRPRSSLPILVHSEDENGQFQLQSNSQTLSSSVQLATAASHQFRTNDEENGVVQSQDTIPAGVIPQLALKYGDKCFFEGHVGYVQSRETNISGFVTHYWIMPNHEGDFVKTKVDAAAVHEDLRRRAIQSRLRKKSNIKEREETQERIRLEAAEAWQNGTFRPTFSSSPHRSPAPCISSFHAAEILEEDNASKDVAQFEETTWHERENDRDDYHDSHNVSSDGENLNESGIEANELSKIVIELCKISAEEIWTLFLNKKFRGGTLARTLLIAAKAVEPKICTPWCGSTKMESKKKEAADQRSSFLMWAKGDKNVLQWIRLEIYRIVLSKQQTYRQFTVTHANAPKTIKVDGKSGSVVQASDDTMARIAHLACHPESRITLNMIFGTKTIEILDSSDLQPDCLWQDLATYFVNSKTWEIQQIPCLQLQQQHLDNHTFVSKIDVTQVPIIGVSGECVRQVFTDIKKMFSNIGTAVFGKTGVNSTGEEFYGKVWSNYVNGPFLHFPRKEVAMYVFKLWNESECNDCLPKYCTKELPESCQVRLGVFKENTKRGFILPVTPRASAFSSLAFGSPGSQASTTNSTVTTMQESITSYISFKMKQEQQPDTVVNTPSFEPPKPDADFSKLLSEHNLLSVWDSSTDMVPVCLCCHMYDI